MRAIVTAIITGAFVLMMGGQVWASDDGHVKEALEHAGKAREHWKQGHIDEAKKHAKESLEHARAAVKAHPGAHKHLDEAVQHLEEGIKHGDMGHGEELAKHVEEAVKHMRQKD